MHPTILRWQSGISWLGTIEISAYFLAVAVGMVLGTFLLWRWARRHDVDGNDALDLAIWTAVFGLVGAKLMHVVADGYFLEYVHICTDPSQVFWDPWRVSADYCRELGARPVIEAGRYVGCVPVERNCLGWINLFAGGYTWYGGLLAGAFGAIWFIRRRRLPFWPLVDTLTWIVMLGLAVGRIGCFFNGCCFGQTTGSWLGVVFPRGSPAWVEQGQSGLIHRHDLPLAVLPTQLFEAAAGIGIALLLALWVERRKRYPGQTFVTGIALYAVARILIEIFRADPRGGLLGLSTSQFVGLLTLAAVGALHLRLGRRPPEPPPEDPTPNPSAAEDDPSTPPAEPPKTESAG